MPLEESSNRRPILLAIPRAVVRRAVRIERVEEPARLEPVAIGQRLAAVPIEAEVREQRVAVLAAVRIEELGHKSVAVPALGIEAAAQTAAEAAGQVS